MLSDPEPPTTNRVTCPLKSPIGHKAWSTGGMMKSVALVAVPDGVTTRMRPDPVAAGTNATIDVVVMLWIGASD